METLLLTWTINLIPDVVNQGYISTSTDPNSRYKEYFDALVYYITQSNFDNIVFCENSSYKLKDYDLIINLCKIYNKNFELIQYVSDKEKVKKYGFHYWEIEAINYAIDNSTLIKKSKNWFKISWRYKYYNINKIIKNLENSDICFYRMHMPLMLWIYTSIFKSNNDFYNKYIYSIIDSEFFKNNKNLEQSFYHKIRNLLIEDNYSMFGKIMPIYNLQHKNMFKFFRNVYYEKIIYFLLMNKLFFDFWGLFDKITYNLLKKND